MSEQTKIQWADSTVNFWSGCTKVSPGCAECYAKALSDRNLGNIGKWGPGAPRQLHESAFKLAAKLNRTPWVCDNCGTGCSVGDLMSNMVSCNNRDCLSNKEGGPDASFHRRRVFSLSLGDWLDRDVPTEWLARMLDTVYRCDRVVWILCSKRWDEFNARLLNVLDFLRVGLGDQHWIRDWLQGTPPSHVFGLCSVEDQQRADERIPEFLNVPLMYHGLSMEPLLGPVVPKLAKRVCSRGCRYSIVTDNPIGHWGTNFNHSDGARKSIYCQQCGYALDTVAAISWLIVGGESGPKARPCDAGWVRDIVKHGQHCHTAVFVKQLGANPVSSTGWTGPLLMVKDKKGADMTEWPAELRVRQWPENVFDTRGPVS